MGINGKVTQSNLLRSGAVCLALVALLTGCGEGARSAAVSPSSTTPGAVTVDRSAAPSSPDPPAASVAPPSAVGSGSSPFNPAASNFSVPPAMSVPTVTMIDAENGAAVVGVSPLGGGEFGGPPTLWLSTDTVHWRDVTPPGARPPVGPDNYLIFDTASFLNPLTGWVTGKNMANLGVTTFRTSDGGRSWSAVPGGSHDDHGGDANWIQLISPTTAIRENIEATAPRMSLDITDNGGASWRTLYTGPPPPAAGQVAAGPFELPVRFISPMRGFAATGIPPAEPQVEGGFFLTTDSASTWHRLNLPSLAGAACSPEPGPAAQCLSTLPTFTDATHGVLATETITGSLATIGFDTSSDGGESWRAVATVTATVVPVPAESYARNYALVATPTATNWWIVSSTRNGVMTEVTTDGGEHWSTVASDDPIGAPGGLEVLDSTHAVLNTAITTSNGTTSALYATSDAGCSWHRLFDH